MHAAALQSKQRPSIRGRLTRDASAVELGKAKVVQLDDEIPGLLIPEGAQQDAARPQGAVRDAALVAERQGFQHTLTDAPAWPLKHMATSLPASRHTLLHSMQGLRVLSGDKDKGAVPDHSTPIS